MGVLVTSAGSTHFNQLNAGGALDEVFNTLILDRGNVSPRADDTTDDLQNRLDVTVATALPALGNTDPRNGGAGADVWTWEFRVSPSAVPAVASSLAIGTEATTALAIHADEVVWTEPYRDLLVWFNLASLSVASLYTAFEDNEVEAARLRSLGARADVLHGGPGGQTLRQGEVRSSVRAGEGCLLLGRLYGEDQRPLGLADVRAVTQRVERYDPNTGWMRYLTRTERDAMYDALQFSALFPYRGGFNFRGSLPGAETRDGADRRVTYELRLSDGNLKVLRQYVRVMV